MHGLGIGNDAVKIKDNGLNHPTKKCMGFHFVMPAHPRLPVDSFEPTRHTVTRHDKRRTV